MIIFAANTKNVGKLTIKYKLNLNCTPKVVKGVQCYPVYMRLTLHRKNTEFPLLTFLNTQVYTNEIGLAFLNNAKFENDDDIKTIIDIVFLITGADPKPFFMEIPQTKLDLKTVKSICTEAEKNISNFIEYYEHNANKNYIFGTRNLTDDLNIFNQSFIEILLDALFYSEYNTITKEILNGKYFGYFPNVLNPFNGVKRQTIERLPINKALEETPDTTNKIQVVNLVSNFPNLYSYYKKMFGNSFKCDIADFFPKSFVEKWQKVSTLYDGNSNKTFGDWIKETPVKDEYIKTLIGVINKDYFKM